MLKEFLVNIVKTIVDYPEEVRVSAVEGQSVCVYELKVHSKDFGKVVGKHGKNAAAIRTILNAAEVKSGKRAVFEIIE